jgi:lysophospholipase L1-like esterase
MMGKIIAYLLFLSLPFNCLGQSLSKSKPIKFLALGDSYTIGESVAENLRWPNQLSDSLSGRGFQIKKTKIIATTGWRTDNLKDAIEGANLKDEYSLISLLIGVNNQYQGRSVEEYGPEFKGLLLTAIKLAKGKKENVFVVSIPDYGYTPFGKPKQPEISKAIDHFNEVNKSIAGKMGVKYVSITEISRLGLDQPDLVAEDGLHPSGKMYSKWVEQIVKSLIK